MDTAGDEATEHHRALGNAGVQVEARGEAPDRAQADPEAAGARANAGKCAFRVGDAPAPVHREDLHAPLALERPEQQIPVLAVAEDVRAELRRRDPRRLRFLLRHADSGCKRVNRSPCRSHVAAIANAAQFVRRLRHRAHIVISTVVPLPGSDSMRKSSTSLFAPDRPTPMPLLEL